MAKDDAGVLVLASPFKFGFFAGLGFCFASLVMSVLSVVFVAVIGIGTIGSLLVGSSATRWRQPETTTADATAVDATPAAAVIGPRPTYHRKSRTSADE